MISKHWEDFPILKRKVNDEVLVYLDNAVTTQATSSRSRWEHWPTMLIFTGQYTLAQEATDLYEETEPKWRSLHASSTKEVLFTRGTTTSLNCGTRLCAVTLAKGEEIWISPAEHHNVVLATSSQTNRSRLTLLFINERGELDLEEQNKP